jgi:hypothetical protein
MGVLDAHAPRLRLVSWRPAEADTRAAQLTALGYVVQHTGLDPRTLRQIREDLPDAVVIDLDRLPSQGRDLGLAVRYYKATRELPLIFLGGETAKVQAIRAILPDAVYGPWDDAAALIKETLANPPLVTSVPQSLLDGYSGAPLHSKLGIKEGTHVLLVSMPAAALPPDLPEVPAPSLGALPAGARVTQDAAQAAGVIVWPVRTQAELDAGLPTWAPRAATARLWIAWPRKTTAWTPEVNQTAVRNAGLAAGLVDYKIARIDDVWTALAFSVRKHDKE